MSTLRPVTSVPVDPVERRPRNRVRTARLVRESLALLASKWTVDVLLALGDGSRRYHELLSDLDGISEKVLTQTLRALERDGLIGRRVHAEVPPRVEYALTPLGATMAAPMKALAAWQLMHGRQVEEARERYEERAAARMAAKTGAAEPPAVAGAA
jgi:DNA-binding HxlR family transcriptional regulator